MGKTYLYFYDTPLNKYSVTALLGAMESFPGLPESVDTRFFCTPEQVTENAPFEKGDTVIFALSFFTSQIWEIHRMVEELKELRKRCTVWFLGGGPHVTGDMERTVTVLGIDYALSGEGEYIFPAAVEALRDGKSPLGLRGVTGYDGAGKLVMGGQADIVELEDYSPDARRFRRYGPIEITRGCPYGCKFCQTGDLMGRGVRHRSVDTVREVIKRADREFPVRFFRALTPNALSYGSEKGVKADLGKVEELLTMLRATLPKEGKIYMGYFPSEVRPNNITPESVALLRRFVDNDDIVIGAQSGSDRILKAAHRGHTAEEVIHAVEILHAGGFIANVDFIFGLPGEEEEDIEKSLAMILRLADMGAKLNVHTFMPLPQTPWTLAKYGSIPPEAGKLIRSLAPRGLVYGDWVNQAAMARRIHSYMATGELY